MHGEMAWLERNQERRCDPREVLPGCRAVICLGMNYYPGSSSGNDQYRIARYSWNDDYHDLIGDRLKAMDLALQALGGTQRYYVDTGPVLERDFATDAGLGWNGKSTVQIHRKYGTWLFLAELLTTLPLVADSPFGDHCGKCTRCITACPTQAIIAPHRVDARRCVSYLTIEHKGSIPLEFRRAIGDRIYGCDDCLSACPWNRLAQVSQHAQFHAREEIFSHSLRDFLSFDDETFRRVFARSPIKRIKRNRFLRNVCIALGNVGTRDDLPALEAARIDADPLIAEHAAWAIVEILARNI
jgi:epoxyqueuosine reductase